MKRLICLSVPALIALMACASAKKLGDNHYQVSCKGDDDSQCQEQAWKTCDGAFKTLNDDKTSDKWEYGESNLPGAMTKVKRYTLDFQCGEK